MIGTAKLRAERDKAMELGAKYKAEAAAKTRVIEDQAARIRVLEGDLLRARRDAKDEMRRLSVEREEYRKLVLACMAVVRTTDARVRESLKMLEGVEDTVGGLVDSMHEVHVWLGDMMMEPKAQAAEEDAAE